MISGKTKTVNRVSDYTVPVNCAENASIYTRDYLGIIETSLVSKYIPLFDLFTQKKVSACLLHVLHFLHVSCIMHVSCMFHFYEYVGYRKWLPGNWKVRLVQYGGGNKTK